MKGKNDIRIISLGLLCAVEKNGIALNFTIPVSMDYLTAEEKQKLIDDFNSAYLFEVKLRQDTAVNKRSKSNGSGYIYLLECKGLYKIGKAKKIRERLKFYQTEIPFPIKVIFQKKVDKYDDIEASLLKKFKNKRIVGEWFKLNKQDIEFFKKNN